MVTILTLALGIGANTGDLLDRQRRDPASARLPEARAADVPDHAVPGVRASISSGCRRRSIFEFRELNQSFAAVGAFTTGEVNLTAGDRPLRVRSASVDDDLLTALGVQPIAGPAVRQGRDRRDPPPNPTGPRSRCRRSASCRTSCGSPRFGGQPRHRPDGGDQRRAPRGDRHHAAGADVMDNRTEIWMPIGLNPGNRQNAAATSSIWSAG